jgi:DNA-binding PadR family transcriptional regulator
VVLGLVSIRPSAGHELARFAERSIAAFFPLTRSHIYSELERLHEQGMLSATVVEQERLPTKRVYETTDVGEAVLLEWLSGTPIEKDRERHSLLVRVFFGERLTRDQLKSMLDEYEASARARRDRLAGVVDHLAGVPEARFPRMTAMYGVRREMANLDWVAEVLPLLEEEISEDEES